MAPSTTSFPSLTNFPSSSDSFLVDEGSLAHSVALRSNSLVSMSKINRKSIFGPITFFSGS